MAARGSRSRENTRAREAPAGWFRVGYDFTSGWRRRRWTWVALVWPLMAGGDAACRAATAQELAPGCNRSQASAAGLHWHQALVGLTGMIVAATPCSKLPWRAADECWCQWSTAGWGDLVGKQPLELHDHVFVPCNLVSLKDAPCGNHRWPYHVHSCRRPLCLEERAAVEAVAALALPLATRLPVVSAHHSNHSKSI